MGTSGGSNKEPHVVLDVLGPTVEFLVLPSESAAGYCIMKGTIPPGVSVPFSLAGFKLWTSKRMVSNG